MSKYQRLICNCSAVCLMFYVYIKDESCIYGILAKKLLEKHNLPYKELNISKSDQHKEELLTRLGDEHSGRLTYPQIFEDERRIGGSHELRKWLKRRNAKVGDKQ